MYMYTNQNTCYSYSHASDFRSLDKISIQKIYRVLHTNFNLEYEIICGLSGNIERAKILSQIRERAF